MTGTNKPNIMSAITNGGRASSVEEKLDNILERLTEIEKILNDPMHGIDMPEGVDMSINPEGIGTSFSEKFQVIRNSPGCPGAGWPWPENARCHHREH